MFDIFSNFSTYPQSVRRGIILLVVSWCWFYFSMYYFFLERNLSGKLLVVGPMICLAVFRIVNWARVLCLVSNAMVVIWSIVFALAFVNSNTTKFAASVVSIVLFALTSYFLMVKESSLFFKTHHQEDEEKEESSEGV